MNIWLGKSHRSRSDGITPKLSECTWRKRCPKTTNYFTPPHETTGRGFIIHQSDGSILQDENLASEPLRASVTMSHNAPMLCKGLLLTGSTSSMIIGITPFPAKLIRWLSASKHEASQRSKILRNGYSRDGETIKAVMALL